MSLNRGVGTLYIGERDYLPDGSYITTEWFFFYFVPLFPLGSRRVMANPFPEVSAQYLELERVPFHWRQVWSTYGALLLGFGWVALVVFSLSRLDESWPGRSQLLTFAGIALGVMPLLVAWMIRRRAKRKVTFSREAHEQTVARFRGIPLHVS